MNTRPVPPSIVITSPSCSSCPPIVAVPSPSVRSSQLATHGLPIPRATTAACEVMPPCTVRIPSAAIIPWMSSGVVSQRTRITGPLFARSTAVSASKTMPPLAAPGDAFRPFAATSSAAFGSIIGCSSWSSCAGSMRPTASSREISPSSTIVTAAFSAAAAVRFAARVCSR